MADLTASPQGNSPVEPSFERPLTRRRDMDGVRGLAVMAIIVFDYGLPWAKGGFTGVDTFLVLSGYFTTQLLARYFELNIFSPWRFYLERLRRIVPALAALVLAVFTAGLFLLSPWESYRFGQEMVAASVFGTNYIYLIRGSFFAERSITYPLLMTWAIGVAMPFWLVLPFLAGYLRRWSRQAAFWAVVVLSVLSLLASVYAEFHEHVWNFFLPVTRAWELGAGSMLALGMPHGSDSARLGAWPAAPWQREVTGAAGLTAVVAAMIFYRPEMRFPGYAALLPVLGAVLLLASEGSTVNSRQAARRRREGALCLPATLGPRWECHAPRAFFNSAISWSLHSHKLIAINAAPAGQCFKLSAFAVKETPRPPSYRCRCAAIVQPMLSRPGCETSPVPSKAVCLGSLSREFETTRPAPQGGVRGEERLVLLDAIPFREIVGRHGVGETPICIISIRARGSVAAVRPQQSTKGRVVEAASGRLRRPDRGMPLGIA